MCTYNRINTFFCVICNFRCGQRALKHMSSQNTYEMPLDVEEREEQFSAVGRLNYTIGPSTLACLGWLTRWWTWSWWPLEHHTQDVWSRSWREKFIFQTSYVPWKAKLNTPESFTLLTSLTQTQSDFAVMSERERNLLLVAMKWKESKKKFLLCFRLVSPIDRVSVAQFFAAFQTIETPRCWVIKFRESRDTRI